MASVAAVIEIKDLVKDYALGRLPVKTADEAAAAVKRIIAYDQAAAASQVRKVTSPLKTDAV